MIEVPAGKNQIQNKFILGSVPQSLVAEVYIVGSCGGVKGVINCTINGYAI